MAAVVCLSDPAEIAAAVPVLLGFYPSDCVVLLRVDGAGRLVCALRADLPGPGGQARLAGQVWALLRRAEPAAAVLLLAYGDWARGRAAAQALRLRLEPGTALLGSWHVDADGWLRALLHDGQQPAPVRIRASAASEVLQAHAVLAGRAVLASHAQIGAGLAPGTRRVRPACNVRPDGVFDVLLTGGPLDDGQVAVLLAGLVETDVRDAVLAYSTDHPEVLAHLLTIVPQAADAQRPDVLATVGMAAYLQGDGALANEAVRQCLTAAPAHRLGSLLQVTLEAGLDPAGLRRQIQSAG